VELLGKLAVRKEDGDMPGYTGRDTSCLRTVIVYITYEAFLTEFLRFPFPTDVDDHAAVLRGLSRMTFTSFQRGVI